MKVFIPLSASNDAVNFDDPIEARRYIRGWIARFKKATGRLVTYVTTNTGYINFTCMTDEEAVFVGKEMKRIEDEARK